MKLESYLKKVNMKELIIYLSLIVIGYMTAQLFMRKYNRFSVGGQSDPCAGSKDPKCALHNKARQECSNLLKEKVCHGFVVPNTAADRISVARINTGYRQLVIDDEIDNYKPLNQDITCNDLKYDKDVPQKCTLYNWTDCLWSPTCDQSFFGGTEVPNSKSTKTCFPGWSAVQCTKDVDVVYQ